MPIKSNSDKQISDIANMSYKEFVELLEARGELVYIVDRGLVKFAKFSFGILAIFAVVGLFLFGIDIKSGADEAKTTRLATQESQIKLAEIKQNIATETKELQGKRDDLEKFINKTKEDTEKEIARMADAEKTVLSIQAQSYAVLATMKSGGNPANAQAAAVATVGITAQSGSTTTGTGPVHIGLVSQALDVKRADLQRIAAALQKQVDGDLSPRWGIKAATIDIFDSFDQIPQGAWPIVVRAATAMDLKNMLSYHSVTQNNGLPYAYISAESTQYNVSISSLISHELLNMLVDPFIVRTISAPSLDPAEKGATVHYLVEVTAPVSGPLGIYKIDGVEVSDFVLPAWFSDKPNEAAPFDFLSKLSRPFQLLAQGGHVNWRTKTTNNLRMAILYSGTDLVFQ